MVLFRVPNISYLVLNRETRKRVVNTREREGAKMIQRIHNTEDAQRQRQTEMRPTLGVCGKCTDLNSNNNQINV